MVQNVVMIEMRMHLVSNMKISPCILRPTSPSTSITHGFITCTFYLALPSLLYISCFRMSEIAINLNFLATAAIRIVVKIPHNTFSAWLASYIFYVL